MRKLNKIQKISILVFFVVLLAISGILYLQKVHHNSDVPSDQLGTVSFTIAVESERDSFSKEETFSSNAESLGGFLRTQDFVGWTDSEYGTYIQSMYGLKEDTANQYWWCVSVNGEAATTGVDDIHLSSDSVYTFTLQQGW